MITMQDVQGGYDAWAAKPHNAKWVRKIDGTPIPNDIVVNIFEALKASRSAEAGKPVVKGLEWAPSAFDTQYGLIIRIAKTPFGPYKILKGTQGRYEVYFGNAPYSGSMDDEDQAKAWAYSDYEARIRSALSTPADSEPVAWVRPQTLEWFAGGPSGAKAEVSSVDVAIRLHGEYTSPLYAAPSAPMGSCEPEDWHCSARQQGTAGGSDPADCDWPLCGCDPYADKVIAALDEVGYAAPVADSERHAVKHAKNMTDPEISIELFELGQVVSSRLESDYPVPPGGWLYRRVEELDAEQTRRAALAAQGDQL